MIRNGWRFLPALPLLLGMPFTCVIAAAQSREQPVRQSDPLRQAQAAWASGRLDEAFKYCLKAIQLHPNSAYTYFLLGAIHDRRGAHQDARASLTRSLQLDPSRVAARILLGRVYLRLGQLNEAGKEFEAAIAAGDNRVEDAHFGLGLVLLLKSQYEEALPHLTSALKAQPDDVLRLFAMAQVDIQLGLGKIQTYLKKIDSISPARTDIHYKLGMLLFQRGMPAESEGQLRRAKELIESSNLPPPEVSLPNLYLALAKLRFGGNDYWGALRELQHIPETAAPLQQEIDFFAGKCLIGAGQPAAGLAKLKAVVQKDPSNASALVYLAWAALLLSQPGAARESLKSLEATSPQDPQAASITALVERESIPVRASVPPLQAWHLKGEGFVCCPCKVPCPCRSNGPPSEGHCESTGFFRIDQGHYGKVRLDHFTFVTVSGMTENCRTPAAVFVGPETTDEQVIALERIYQSFNPLEFVLFPSVKRVPISYVQHSQVLQVDIPGKVQLKIERQLDGSRPRMQTAALDHFANSIEYSRNLIYRYWDDAGVMQWDFSGRQANFRTINLNSGDYANGGMLIQFQDTAGYFNEKQMELIRRFKLPMLPSYGKRTTSP